MKQLIAILGAFCSIATLSAEIKVASNLTPIYEEMPQCDSDTLFLIDVGGTLLIHKDPVLHISHDEWKGKWFKENCPDLSSQEKIALVHVVEENDKSWLLADNWPDLIEKAREFKIKTVAFTKVLMDPSLENIRIERLKRFGLIFKDELSELPNKNELFIYRNGVIQTGQKLKGPVLKEVVSKLKQCPMKVVFIDDRIEQIKSVEEVCKEMNIPFVGFHYTAFKESPHLDEKIARKQLETLVKEHKWLSCEDISPGCQKLLGDFK